MRRFLLVPLVVSAIGAACATAPSTPSPADAQAASLKSQKDRTACLKMCEMAGAAEGKNDEVAACQAQCPAAAGSADGGATAP